MNELHRPHPGEMIQDEILTPLGLSLPEAAVMLGVLPEDLARVIIGQGGITQELACSLERAGFSMARFWVAFQEDLDRSKEN